MMGDKHRRKTFEPRPPKHRPIGPAPPPPTPEKVKDIEIIEELRKLRAQLSRLDDVEMHGRIMHESWTRTKRSQGFHHPSEPCTNPYIKCGTLSLPGNCGMQHPDLVPWDELPEAQKDINRNAFKDVIAWVKGGRKGMEPMLDFILRMLAGERNGRDYDTWFADALKGMEKQSAEIIRLQNELSDARDSGYKKERDKLRAAVDWALEQSFQPATTDDPDRIVTARDICNVIDEYQRWFNAELRSRS